MPASGSPGKKGHVTRVTRVHEDRDIVRITREGDEGVGPVTEVVDHRQTRSSVSYRNKGKKAAALPSPGATETSLVPRSDALDSLETEDLLSEAEAILQEPIQGGKRNVTTQHNDEAGPSRLDHGGESEPADTVPDTQHHIEEVHPETVEDGTAEPHIAEPDSDVPASPERSAPAKSGGIMPRVRALLSSIVHTGEEADGPSAKASMEETTSKEQAPARAATRSSKQAEKGKAIAPPPATPAKKGIAAAKRAAEPTTEMEQSPQKVAKHSAEAAPLTPAKAPPSPAGSAKQPAGVKNAAKASSSKAGRPSQKGSRRKRRSVETYKTYIYKVLKEVHPDVGISKQGMQVMQTFAVDMFDRIMVEASRLCRISNKATLSSREIQTAVRLLMPGELSKHAVTEGTKAVTKATQD
ncbi:hypothetical protein WJX77_000094 [Trebouxia sp. C0004]